MRHGEVFESKYLKAAALELGGGKYRTMVLTIKGIPAWTEFDDGNRQRVIGFQETDKLLGLNNVNWTTISEISGQDDDEQWAGTVIELYVDKNVTYGGKKVPAIRIRQPEAAAPVAPVTTKAGAWAAWIAKRGAGFPPALFSKAVDEIVAATGTAKDKFGPVEFQMLASMAEPEPLPPGGVAIDESEIPFDPMHGQPERP